MPGLVYLRLSDALIQLFVNLAPTLILLLVFFVILSWIRVLVDSMSGRDF